MASSDDDLFGDLLGPKKTTNTSSGKGNGPTKPSSSGGKPRNPLPSDAFTSESHEDKSTLADVSAGLVGAVTREELHAVVSGAVQSAIDATFSKFVKSLRTVLEDLGRRVDTNKDAVGEVKEALGEIVELLDSQAQNTHARFTSIDVAVKDVDRGVQALRDR